MRNWNLTLTRNYPFLYLSICHREGIQMCSEINNKLGEGGCGMDLPDNMLFYLQIFFFNLRLNITGKQRWYKLTTSAFQIREVESVKCKHNPVSGIFLLSKERPRVWTWSCLRQWVWRERSKEHETDFCSNWLNLQWSCDLVNKLFNFSEIHRNKGIMILEGYHESIRVSNFLTSFPWSLKWKTIIFTVLAIIYAYRGAYWT